MKHKYIIMLLLLVLCGCQSKKRKVEAYVTETRNEPINKILIDFNELLVVFMSTIAIIIAIINVIRYEIHKFRMKSKIVDLERTLSQQQQYPGTIPQIDYYVSNGKLKKRTTYENINGETNRPLFDVEDYEGNVNDLTKLKDNEIVNMVNNGGSSNSNK
jgi:hypothetical protein